MGGYFQLGMGGLFGPLTKAENTRQKVNIVIMDCLITYQGL